jgi:hypothetical protein
VSGEKKKRSFPVSIFRKSVYRKKKLEELLAMFDDPRGKGAVRVLIRSETGNEHLNYVKPFTICQGPGTHG